MSEHKFVTREEIENHLSVLMEWPLVVEDAEKSELLIRRLLAERDAYRSAWIQDLFAAYGPAGAGVEKYVDEMARRFLEEKK